MALIAVYPGTFDPITNGHVDLANRGCKLFSKVVIAVAKNPQKNTLFTIDERVGLIEEIFNRGPKELSRYIGFRDSILNNLEDILVLVLEKFLTLLKISFVEQPNFGLIKTVNNPIFVLYFLIVEFSIKIKFFR